MKPIKCITFDKEAQDALPEHIKVKMKADKEKAQKEQKRRIKIPICPHCSAQLHCQCTTNQEGEELITDAYCFSCKCNIKPLEIVFKS